ncbi:Ltp family lipoprotein [Leuconostoc lactis]|uniref:Ltp family lipoprotein n=1 Tax=Leuconostoc lactis TaxID=1246 RepID=UPI0006DC739A|nr:Ltp family lipoprotein [Leuconostoc lactis]KQB82424.1 hypothetical protein AN225_02895 [Leuconostoc lactis]QEA48123.1 hypothetical protein FGL80_07935 [Leuconostoc lactis]
MAKKIVDENGNTYVQVKPLYKRVWFWGIAAAVIIFAVISVSDSKTSESNNTTSSTSVAQSSTSSSVAEKPKVSAEYLAALGSAKTYSDSLHMSKAGIYDQLTSDDGEKFPADAAQYAVDNLKADYNKNALETAKNYQKNLNMSTEAIRDQLTSDDGEKFTPEEADYAAQHLND